MSAQLPLQGLRVVELASVLAGPSVGSFLAELGAAVIKVENPKTKGDTTRQWKTAGEDPDAPVSSYYASANWNKQVVFLDLTQPADLQQVHAYLKDADVLLENFKPGDELKFGLGFQSLKKLYPKLIVGHIQGFPDSDRPAFDIVLQAETGYMSLNGASADGLKWPLPIVDILAAHQLKEGLLVALLQRMQSGMGALVSVSLYEAAIASLANVAGNVLMAGADPVSLGRLHPNIAPYGETITTADGVTLVLAVGTDQQFAHLCEVLGLDSDFRNKFSTNSARLAARHLLENELRAKASAVTFAGLEPALIGYKVPFGRVRTVKEALQLQPETAFLREETEGLNTVKLRTGIFKIAH
jgi:crotonobetainyl-CoA:carnitine CoA-transferase CaiB-like acyl-CoA transferase